MLKRTSVRRRRKGDGEKVAGTVTDCGPLSRKCCMMVKVVCGVAGRC